MLEVDCERSCNDSNETACLNRLNPSHIVHFRMGSLTKIKFTPHIALQNGLLVNKLYPPHIVHFEMAPC